MGVQSVIVRPSGAVSAQFQHQVGAGAHWQLESDQSDGTYVNSFDGDIPGLPYYDVYSHDALTLPSGTTITKVVGHGRVSHQYSYAYVAGISMGFKIGASYYSSGLSHNGIFYPTFHWSDEITWTANPATGAAWTVSDFNNAQFQINIVSYGLNPIQGEIMTAYFADIYYEVFYTAPDPYFKWIDGTATHYIDGNGAERYFEGVLTGLTFSPDQGGINGTEYRYVDANGDERYIEGVDTTENFLPDQIGINGTEYRYVDDNGDERYIEGALV